MQREEILSFHALFKAGRNQWDKQDHRKNSERRGIIEVNVNNANLLLDNEIVKKRRTHQYSVIFAAVAILISHQKKVKTLLTVSTLILESGMKSKSENMQSKRREEERDL